MLIKCLRANLTQTIMETMVFIGELIFLPIKHLIRLVLVVPITLVNFFKQRKQCPPIEDDLLLMPANVLVKKITRREITCRSLIESYIKRINAVNPLINAVVDQRFSKALEEASDYDDFITKSDLTAQQLEEKFPLLGIPISIKESIAVNGMSNAAGSANAKGKRADEDADVVATVKKAGAIILVVSNTPELCLDWETSNKMLGTTCNPYDTRRTPGGSSGGEGSLLGAGASLIGLGSDIAGSLRLPAHFCGIFSHKPTMGLVSMKGHFPGCSDTEKWTNCFTLGPMARYASDLPTMVKLLVKPEMKDLLKLDETVSINKVKFYYLDHNESILSNKVDDEILNAMKNVTNYFETRHSIKINKMSLKCFRSSSMLSYLHLLSIRDVQGPTFDGKDHNLYLELLKYIFCASKSTLNGVLYYILHGFARKILGESGCQRIKNKNESLRKELEDVLGDDGVLLYPTFPSVAHYHGLSLTKIFDSGFMTVFNAFGLPVSNCPIGYSKGLPMGIQVIAKRNCDRLSLAVAQEIEVACGGWNSDSFNVK